MVRPCGALMFTDHEISWVFSPHDISGPSRTLNLAQRWRLVRGRRTHLDFWKKFFIVAKFAKKLPKIGQNAKNVLPSGEVK